MAAEIPEDFDFETEFEPEFAEEAPKLFETMAKFRQAQNNLHSTMAEFAKDSSDINKWWRVAARRNELSASFDESVNALAETEPDHEILSKAIAGLIFESDDARVNVTQILQPLDDEDYIYPTLREDSPDLDCTLLDEACLAGTDGLIEKAYEVFDACLRDDIQNFKDRAILKNRGDI